MKPHRFNRTVDIAEAFADGTAVAKRRSKRRLKAYLKTPNLPRALAFDAAAEAEQIAVYREHNARKLKESWR